MAASQAYTLVAFRRPGNPASDPVELLTNAFEALFGASSIKLLSCKILEQERVYELTIESDQSLKSLRDPKDLRPIEDAQGFDLVWLPTAAFPNERVPKLAIFDMDSTLIQQEVIDLLAAKAGVEPLIASITARAMNGELDFYESLKERVALLKDIPSSVFEDLKPELNITPGADVLLKVLQKFGCQSALLSGGFLPLARYIGGRLHIDYVHANSLEERDGKLTGKLEEGKEIVTGERKRELLLEIRGKEGVEAGRVLAVGDGANDLPMLGEAGLGVAVNAKPRVQDLAPARLNCQTLRDVLYLFGLTNDEIDRLSRA